MKNYPESEGRIYDIAECVVLCVAAAMLCLCVYLAVYFSRIILGA